VPLLDRFRAFSSRQQIMLICLLAAASTLIFTSIWFFLLRTSYQPLFTNLRPADAATIVADLDRKKISYRLADGGRTILVPAEVADSTRLNVSIEDLPLKGTVGFELFNKSDMGLTDFTQKINYQRALQGELERTIMTLDGIDAARVHLSLGEDRIFRDDRVPPKASVTIRAQKGVTLSPKAAAGIQRLVAAAVPNLQAGDVVVLDESGGVIGQFAPAQIATPFGEIEQGIEQYYEGRIRQALNQTYPQAGIIVSVMATIAAKAGRNGGVDWTPADRDFPLQIAFASAAPLDSNTQEKLRALGENTVGFDLAKGDAIVFGIAPEAPAPRTLNGANEAARRPVATFVASREESSAGDWQTLGTAGLVLGLLLVLVLAAARRLRAPRRLSDKQRQDFVARLRTALQQGGSHAAGRP
jgi:flagellar M-ring protein FliF